MSYDQWKTASPYDDEPDYADELEKLALKCEEYVKVHAEISDLTHELRVLLLSCSDTMREVADYILNEL